jgi:hypothetical protein
MSDTDKIRAEFEAHWRTIQSPSKANRELNQRDGNEYAHGHVARHWMTWQAATLKAAPQWRDIADAPRDESLLLYAPSYGVFEGYWKDRWYNDKSKRGWVAANLDEEYGCLVNDVSHWMPLPAPPAPGGDK